MEGLDPALPSPALSSPPPPPLPTHFFPLPPPAPCPQLDGVQQETASLRAAKAELDSTLASARRDAEAAHTEVGQLSGQVSELQTQLKVHPGWMVGKGEGHAQELGGG